MLEIWVGYLKNLKDVATQSKQNDKSATWKWQQRPWKKACNEVTFLTDGLSPAGTVSKSVLTRREIEFDSLSVIQFPLNMNSLH